MTKQEELLKLLDRHIEILKDDNETIYLDGFEACRWLVYNFFNAPRPAKEPSLLTEEELKDFQEEEDNE